MVSKDSGDEQKTVMMKGGNSMFGGMKWFYDRVWSGSVEISLTYSV